VVHNVLRVVELYASLSFLLEFLFPLREVRALTTIDAQWLSVRLLLGRELVSSASSDVY